jgi:hypothetical protein
MPRGLTILLMATRPSPWGFYNRIHGLEGTEGALVAPPRGRTGLRAARTRKPNALFDSIDGQRAILLCGLEQYLRVVLIAKNDALKRRREKVPVDVDFPVYGFKRTRVFANMVQQALVNFRRQFNHYFVHGQKF